MIKRKKNITGTASAESMRTPDMEKRIATAISKPKATIAEQKRRRMGGYSTAKQNILSAMKANRVK